jgi:hypothetical protein
MVQLPSQLSEPAVLAPGLDSFQKHDKGIRDLEALSLTRIGTGGIDRGVERIRDEFTKHALFFLQ